MQKQNPRQPASIAQLRTEFWQAGNEELLSRAIVSAGINRSTAWLELKAVTGGGIPYLKCGRRCLYKKSDVMQWLDEHSQRVHSTSEYIKVPPIGNTEGHYHA